MRARLPLLSVILRQQNSPLREKWVLVLLQHTEQGVASELREKFFGQDK